MKQPGVLGILGCAPVQKKLLESLRSGRLHPSLILAGPNPELKFRTAKNLAKALLCEKPGVRAFCATCSACRRIDKELHPDVLFVREPDEDTIKIELVRSLCHQMEISPLEAAHKICIVQECHRMSNASANAFLKTLEEPAPNRHFWLLTTQAGSLLPTILSRCLTFAFGPEEETAASAPSPDRQKQIAEWLTEALETRTAQPLVANLDQKESCLEFLGYLQHQFHAVALEREPSALHPAFRALGKYEALLKFDAVLGFEGRLRSNANCGLLLEDFIRRELLKESGA
jgi:DNA polymerase III delta prime subunit